jgi:HAD superfamily hydrolase (TIGR01509 family)
MGPMNDERIASPAAVLLDLDGTLVDTVGTRIEAWMRTFGEHDIPADRRFVAELIGADGKRLAHEVAARDGRTLDEDAAEGIDARSGQIYSELNTDPRPLPGVADFLDAVESAGLPWAVATSSRREQVGRSVAALRRATEPRIVDGSSVRRAKPAPDLLLAAAATIHVDPAACWCVGDSIWDMRAAVAAGMTPLAVLAGSAVSADALAAAGAQLTVERIDHLIPMLERPMNR